MSKPKPANKGLLNTKPSPVANSRVLAWLEGAILALPKREFRKKSKRKVQVIRNALRTCVENRRKIEELEVHGVRLPEVLKLYDASQFCMIDLRYIRIIAAAHRDHDVKRQLEVIETIDTRRLMDLSKELVGILVLFTRLMTDVLMELNVWKQILKKPAASR